MKKGLLILFGILLIGCVHTRDPQITSMTQKGDVFLKCDQIKYEYSSNTEIAAKKIKKNQINDVQDFILGLLIWPGLADFKNADGTEGNALLDRNIKLKNMALSRGCDVALYPHQPRHYQ